MNKLDADTIQGYACWTVAGALGIVVAIIIVLSVVEWVG